MNFLLKLLAVAALAVAVLGFVAPKEMKVEKNIVINRPKNIVFLYLKSLRNGDNWNPWVRKDPNIVKNYKGVDGTVGFIYSWSGNSEVGVGEQEIQNIIEGERIDFELRFKKPMEDTNSAYLITQALGGNQTKVIWGMTGKTPFPKNVICLVMGVDKKLGHDFEQGLSSLKALLEQ